MHLPLLQPISNNDIYITGDVSIDASAAIAPGVIIQADPDSKVIIGAGVCIGMGTILHAHKGTLEVEAGATIGAGVLVVGNVKIATHACIGSLTTIWNETVAPNQFVVAGSLIGDTGRQIADSNPEPVAENESATNTTTEVNKESAPVSAKEAISLTVPETPQIDIATQNQSESPQINGAVPIYGQANLNRLLHTLFPHNKSLNSLPENSSE